MKTLKSNRFICVLTVLLGLIFAVSFATAMNTPTTAYAETTDNPTVFDTSPFIFTRLNDTECSVRLSDKTVEIAVVPEKVIIENAEYTVTAVAGSGFASATNLKKVRLPKSIKEIGTSAFANCQELVSIILPAVEKLGSNIFTLCSKLEYLILPKTIQQVGTTILRNTNTQIYIRLSEQEVQELNWPTNWNGNNANQNIQYSSDFTPAIEFKEITASTFSINAEPIGYYVDSAQPFWEPRDGGLDVYIPATYEGKPVVGIEDSAFAYNEISTLTIGYAAEPIHIRSNAFNGLMGEQIIINRDINIEDVNWEGDEQLAEYLFADSTVSIIVLPNSICGFGKYMFIGCSNLRDIRFISPTTMTKAQEMNIANTMVSTGIVNLPETTSFTIIEEEALSQATQILELNIPSNVTSVGPRIIVSWGTLGTQTVKIDFNSEADAIQEGWNVLWKEGCQNNVIEFQGIFAISYVLNGGSHAGNPTVYTSKDNITLNNAEKTGYTFNGWYADPNFAGERIDTILKGSSGDKTLYAKFTANTYQINYEQNKPDWAVDKEVFGSTLPSRHTYDVTKALSVNGYTLVGWIFTGWNTKADGSGISYVNNQNVANLTVLNNDVVRLYAQWTQDKYKIRYQDNKPYYASAILQGKMPDSEFKYDEEYNLPINTFDLEGWTFTGWNTKADGTGFAYSNNQKVKNVDTLLYAQWRENSYSVQFLPNVPQTAGVFNNAIMGNLDGFKYDTAKTLTNNQYSITGWTFRYWTTNANGTGAQYANSSQAKCITPIDGSTAKLYAQWERITYSITYGNMSGPDADGNIITCVNPNFIYSFNVDTDTITFAPPYGLIGATGSWSVPSIPKGTTQNIVTNTVWRLHRYTIHVLGGNVSAPENTINVRYDETVTITAPAKASNNQPFDHWEMDNLHMGTANPIQVRKLTDIDDAHVYIYAYYKESCVAEGSLITLADGSQKAVEDLIGDEQLLVWNLFTGMFDTAPILFIDSDSAGEYEVINLTFSDGTKVKVVSEHGFWDFDLNKYVFLRKDAAQYIGHWFNKQMIDANGNLTYTKVQLTNVVVANEITTAWSPVTFGHLCYYVNGMLSMPGATTGLINIFDVDPATMKIDAAQYAADLSEYGLYTYAEFAETYPVPEVVFEAFGGKYLKVAMGKGLLTEDMLGSLIARYSKFF